MTVTVDLVMIVRDEAEIISRCLRSAAPHVNHVTLIDTGSTDRTIEIAYEVLGELGVPVKVDVQEFVDFGTTRTQAINAAGHDYDYLLLLDADMTVEGEIPAELGAEAYDIEIRDEGDWRYRRPQLIKSRHRWHYRGVVHEWLDGGPTPFEQPLLEGFHIVHHGDGGRRDGETLRSQDLELLERAYIRDPDDPRTAFYLAQTYEILERWNEAIDVYRRRADMAHGFDEERYYARYKLGSLLCSHVGINFGAPELLAAFQLRPHRAEALRALERTCRYIADAMPVPSDRLFVHAAEYGRQQSDRPDGETS